MKPEIAPPIFPYFSCQHSRSSQRRLTYRTDLHSNTDTSLHASANVVAVPRGQLWNIWVDAQQDEESGKVFDAVALNSEQNDEADYSVIVLAGVSKSWVKIQLTQQQQCQLRRHLAFGVYPSRNPFQW